MTAPLRALLYDAEGWLTENRGHPSMRPPVSNPPPVPSSFRDRRAERNERIALGLVNATAVLLVAFQLNLPT